MKTKILITLSLLLLSHPTFAFQKEIDKFFELYESGKPIDAVDSIYSSNKWTAHKTDDLHTVKTQLQNLTSLVGEYHGKVKIGEYHVAERLYHISYLALYDRQPVRLEFVFYKPKNNWVLNGFSFDDEIDDELQEFARDKVVGYVPGS
ncbi:hypothetical protein AB4259_22705 [Vibrio amylolyticus]|uniref:hypothetical protein n=1 Tax=Vibrio amylolyticus TaxID=2847292 RepID=UPI00354BFEBF